MPAAAIVLPLAETVFGGAISSFVGSSLAAAGILAEGTLGAIETGAIIGAGEGAVNAAVSGGYIAKGALTGGVGGGVGAGVGAQVSSALAEPSANVYGPVQPNVGGSAALGSGATGAAAQGAGSFAGALAGGAPLSTALQAGLRGVELGGISGLASGFAKEAGIPASESKTIGTAASQLASYALPSVSGGSSTPTYTPPIQPGLSLQGPLPSPTLGQSLSIAPSLGYTSSRRRRSTRNRWQRITCQLACGSANRF